MVSPDNRKVIIDEDRFIKDSPICTEYSSYYDGVNKELKLLLVDCVSGICKQTIGYIMEKECHLFRYSEIGSNGKAIDHKNGSTDPINLSSYSGELYKDGDVVGVIIENNIKLGFIIGIENKRYVNRGTHAVFNSSYNIIKRSKNYIIRDLFYNGGEWYYFYVYIN